MLWPANLQQVWHIEAYSRTHASWECFNLSKTIALKTSWFHRKMGGGGLEEKTQKELEFLGFNISQRLSPMAVWGNKDNWTHSPAVRFTAGTLRLILCKLWSVGGARQKVGGSPTNCSVLWGLWSLNYVYLQIYSDILGRRCLAMLLWSRVTDDVTADRHPHWWDVFV